MMDGSSRREPAQTSPAEIMSGLTSAATFHFHALPQPGLLPSAFAFGFGEIASKRSEDGGERIKSEGERKTQIQVGC